jgi:transposase
MGTSPGRKKNGEGGVSVEYGTVKALHAIAERIGLIDIVNQAAPKRNGLPVGELVLIMAANRILDPRPKYTIAEWYQRTYMPELLGVDLPPDSAYQTLTRCLDYLTDDVQADIEMALAGRVMESFHLKPKSFIYDVTSTFVEGEGGAEILQYGYSRDHRPDCRQVNYSLCVTMNPTVPLFHQAFPGNTVDSKTVKETMVRFKDRLGLDGCLVVDRGIVTSANIVEIVDERKLDLVGGLRMDKRFRALALKTSLKSFGKPFTLKDEALHAKEFAVDIGGNDRRCILYYSEEKAERDKKSREIRLARVKEGLVEVAASLTREGAGRKPTRNGIERRIVLLLEKNHCERLIDWRLVGGRGGRRLKWELNEAAINEEEVLDGRYWLVTTLDDSPKNVIDTYRARDAVERGFRITKETIKIRPIWNRTEQHIKAHLFVCFIAYLLYSLLEIEARKEISGITGAKALDRLRKFMERATRPRYMTPTGEDLALLSRVSRVR